jgi:membrane-bound ClpP family serine protease
MPAIIQSLGAVLIFAGAWLHLCDRNNEFIGMTLGTGVVLFVIGMLMS